MTTNTEPITGAKFKYLGGVFTINAVYPDKGWMFFTDPKGVIGEMEIHFFKKFISEGVYELVTNSPDDERLQLKKLRRELIQKHLEGWYGSEKSSIRYYFESGNVSGSLHAAIEKIMEEYREFDPSANT